MPWYLVRRYGLHVVLATAVISGAWLVSEAFGVVLLIVGALIFLGLGITRKEDA